MFRPEKIYVAFALVTYDANRFSEKGCLTAWHPLTKTVSTRIINLCSGRNRLCYVASGKYHQPGLNQTTRYVCRHRSIQLPHFWKMTYDISSPLNVPARLPPMEKFSPTDTMYCFWS